MLSYIEKLKDTSDLDALYQDAMMIGEFGTDATNAIPNLIAALNPTNHPVIQAHAVIALGMTHTGKGKPTTINSVFGFMSHGQGTVNVLDGTVVNSEEAIFLAKAGGVASWPTARC